MSESSIDPVADQEIADANAFEAELDALALDAEQAAEADALAEAAESAPQSDLAASVAANDEAAAEADEGSEPSLPDVEDEHNVVAISVEEAVASARAGGATEADIRDLIYNAQAQQPTTASSPKRSLDEVAEAASEAAQDEADLLAGPPEDGDVEVDDSRIDDGA